MQENGEISTQKIIIAIDGPAASGKSTTARKVAGKLGYTYIDTGAMYRSVALKVIENGLLDTLKQAPEQVAGILEGISIAFDGDRVLLEGRDVSREIRDNRVSREVSFISSLKPVRDSLLVMQQALGRGRGVVMDGRDIGTVVFPEAELKIFLVADARQRAMRRLLELQAKSPDGTGLPDLETLEREIMERDRADAERELAPLRKHPDAVKIDTSRLSIDEQVEMVYGMAVEKERENRS
ncbi:(d)CMP kinase [Pelodictyon luteolum]|uniref:Cytidylate kinase n=1 Tax=Chlorobium luteolum (strain DSM 273 / BCRC 81028 / 2530) TaxID=319225 RepID=Q3B244_CHLL3|nr:(d)CMP kinase [Pelodictyon luteolum]ABB24587.1 cytidylate kinase [Pelodictyon luteolum DSM 273]